MVIKLVYRKIQPKDKRKLLENYRTLIERKGNKLQKRSIPGSNIRHNYLKAGTSKSGVFKE